MTNNAINSNIPVEVAKGGIGTTTLTQYSPLIGHATADVGAITAGTNGQLLIGATGADPAFASLTSPNGTIIYTAGAGSLNLDIVNATGKTTSFVPVLSFGGGTTGITYASQICTYLRIGNIIYFAINIILTSKGTSTGAVAITLPINTATGKFAINVLGVVNVAFSDRLVAYADGGSVFIFNSASGSAAAAITNTGFANDSRIWISGCYLV